MQRKLALDDEYTVRSVSLETFLDENNIDNVDLLMMNCEGAETGVLKQLAASSRLRAMVYQVAVEFHPQIHGDRLTVETMMLLEHHYAYEVLSRNRLGHHYVRFTRRPLPRTQRSIALRLELAMSYPRDFMNIVARRIRRDIFGSLGGCK